MHRLNQEAVYAQRKPSSPAHLSPNGEQSQSEGGFPDVETDLDELFDRWKDTAAGRVAISNATKLYIRHAFMAGARWRPGQ